MLVRGVGALHAGHANSGGDHRLAMLGAAAAMLADGESLIEGSGSVAVSYPDFWGHLAQFQATEGAVSR
jgi:3-phosphoshikimate 1-carboxyvinyltransferase